MDEEDIGVTKAAPSLLRDIKKLLDDLQDDSNDYNQLCEKLKRNLDPFQEAPQLLDPILENIVVILTDEILRIIGNETESANWPFDVLYTLCKVRGYKTICQFLPPHVYLLEDILSALDGNDGNRFTPVTWQQRYCLLLWLSIVILAPFDLDVFGSTIQNRGYDVAMRYISVPGKERDAAILVMSRLVTRSDSRDVLMTRFFRHVMKIWKEPHQIFVRLGILQTTAMIFQLAPSDKLYDEFFTSVLLIESGAGTTSAFDKLKVKNLGRIAIGLLLQVADDDEYFSHIEDIIGKLLKYLSHKDTLVRYSTSKAIARIVQKLPADFQADVINEVLTIIDETTVFDQVNPSSWHGALLCLAEMLRRQLLVADVHFKRLQTILHLSLRFEQQKLTYSLGDNVRDASCYVCWSLFRVYKNIDRSIIDCLFQDLIDLSIYDPEVNIRRAASASLQEGIGRQGGCNGSVETQIALVQTIDYFKVGLRTRSYLEVSLQVYNLGFKSIVDYVLERVVCNWDPAVRRLSGESLKLLVANEDETVVYKVVRRLFDLYNDKNVDARHGTVYALGEIFSIDSLVIKGVFENSITSVKSILNDFTEYDLKSDNELLNCDSFLNLYKCLIQHRMNDERFTRNLSFCLELNDKHVVRHVADVMLLFQAIDEVGIPKEIIDGWIQRMLSGKSSFAAALGYTTDVDRLEKVLNSLMKVIKGSNEVVVVDMLTRSEAVHSLGRLIVWLDKGEEQSYPINEYLDTLIVALNDYTIDSRGDVGSWVRKAGIEECTRVYNCKLATASFKKSVIERLLGMSVEVLFKLRVCAIQHLQQIPLEDNMSGIINSMPDEFERSARVHYSHMTKIFDLKLDSSTYTSYLNSYISAAGAQHVSEDTLHGSLDAFIEYLRQLDENRLKQVLNDIADLLDIPKYGTKSVTCTLKVISTILESGVMWNFNDAASLKRLYTKTFNCHINTKSLPRILSAVDIFSGLAQLGHIDSLKRLGVLCKHPFPIVRVKSAECIREVFMSLEVEEMESEILQSIELLEEIDWNEKNDSHGEEIQNQIRKIAIVLRNKD